jgi:hypothetical protein
LSAGILAEAPARRQNVQAGVSAVQAGAPHPDGNGQGEEPVAQRGRPLGRHPAALRSQGDELLHGAVWRFARPRHARLVDLGPRPRSAHRAPQVHVHRGTDETGRRQQVNCSEWSCHTRSYLFV